MNKKGLVFRMIEKCNKKLLSDSWIQCFCVMILHCVVSLCLLRVFSIHATSYFIPGTLMLVACFFVYFVHMRKFRGVNAYNHQRLFKRYQVCMSLLAMGLILIEVFLIPQTEYSNSGLIYTCFIGAGVVSVLIANVYFMWKMNGEKCLLYLMSFYSIGALTLLFYFLNQQSMFYTDISQVYPELVLKTVGIYAGIMIMYFVLHKRAKIEWNNSVS